MGGWGNLWLEIRFERSRRGHLKKEKHGFEIFKEKKIKIYHYMS
jgi:hypothetical protein